MTKPLSPDLRIRIIQAVEVEGLSCRAAAERFGVAPSTAVDLLRQWKVRGTYKARQQGGDRRSAPIEAHAAELVAGLRERGASADTQARRHRGDGQSACPQAR
jgi:transposase